MSAPRRTLREAVRRYAWHYALGTLALALVNLCDVALPLVLKVAIDDIVALGGLVPIGAIAGAYVLLVLFQGGWRYFWRRWFLGASHHIANEVRERLYAHLLRLSAGYFNAQRTGDLMSRATNDLETVRQFFAMGVLLTLDTLMYVAIVPPIMVSLSPRLTLLSLAPLALVPLVVHVAGRAIQARFRRVQDAFGDMSSHVEETAAGIRVVKSFAQEARQIERFRALAARSFEQSVRLARVEALVQPAVGALMGVATFAVVLAGGLAALRGEISIGSFVAFQTYLARLAWPMQAIGMTVGLYQRGLASVRRIDEVLGESPEIEDGLDTVPGAQVERGDVEVRGLTFRYESAGDGGGARAVLSDVSLRVPPGGFVALVGPVGSGKSTLLHLIPRLFDPPPGTVFVDGMDVRRYPVAALRAAIGLVPQETFLFAASVADNVRVGAPHATRAEVEDALEAASIRAEVEALPGGLDAELGERGINLSGGQRQRLAIARALARRPRILLLDDCLSAVDAETEAAILARLREQMRGRTCIVASHRLAAIKDANEILVLDGGRVVERGRHEDLLARGGLYADLWARQRLEQELEIA